MASALNSERLVRFILGHSRAVTLAFAGLCVWGAAALFTLPSGIYPDVAFPRIVIIAERGEDSVENLMIGVTRPMEEAASAVPGLRRLRSKTIRGASELSLDFLPSADMRDALSQVRARAGEVAARTPGLALTIEQQTPSVFPVISFNISLDKTRARLPVGDIAALNDWVQLNLKPRLARIPDVFLVTVQGAETRQWTVEADPPRLAAAGLTLENVIEAIRAGNAVGAMGILERDYRQFQLLASAEIRSIETLESIPISTPGGGIVHLRDVARCSLGVADRTSVVTGNAEDSVVVSIFMRYGGKVTEMSDRVAATLEEERALLPPGASIHPVYDQAGLVRESLGGVRDAIMIGIALAIGVLWVFLASWRLTLIAGVSIPISVLGTFAVMSALGESLNLMSLGGIAVAIGLIIDDAIVVVENIARRISEGKGRVRAATRGTGEILGAVVGSSLTTVIVLAPLVMLEGVVGQFFRSLAVSLGVGILVSMLVSLSLTPVMASGRIGPRPGDLASRRWIDGIAAAYERAIRRLMARPWIGAGALAIALLAGAAGVMRQATGFLPEMDEGGFVLDYRMPVGTSLGETDKNCRKIERILAETAGIDSFSRRTGMELGFFATEQFTGDFLVGLKPRSHRRPFDEIIPEIRDRIAHEIPQIDVSFVQVMQDTINDLAGNPAPIEVKVFGNDYRSIQRTVKAAAESIASIPGIVDVQSGVSFGSPEIVYQLDRDAIARAGLTPEGVEGQFRAALTGEEANRIRQGERLIPVVVRYPDAYRRDTEWLRTLPLTGGEAAIPASQLAMIEERLSPNELARENQQPVVSIEANISGIDLGSASRRIKAALAGIAHPPDVRFEIAGQAESADKAFWNLVTVLLIGMGLVWLLLVIQFQSYRLPLAIFLTLPASQIGALLALRLTGTPLNISSFMGLIMLVGLVVKNGIIFIECAAQLREEGAPTLIDALATAGRLRLRPILMTSLTAIIALAPLALNLGAGAELQRPLAIAVIGGLSVSTLFTLLTIPIAHAILGEPRRELEEAS